jgi:transcription elongation factor Elf1
MTTKTNKEFTGGAGSNDNEQLVAPKFACPDCGERRADELIINEDNRGVTCVSCGQWYQLPHDTVAVQGD